MTPTVGLLGALIAAAPRAAGGACEVELSGDAALVTLVSSRLELGRIDRARCATTRVHLSGVPEAVRVAVETHGEWTVRTMTDVDMAAVLIESWAFQPEEARRKVVRPRLRILSKERARVVLPSSQRRARVAIAPELSMGLDGRPWLGPKIEVFLEERQVTAGVVLRGAATPSAGGSGDAAGFVDVALMLGRDVPIGALVLEPRGGFGFRHFFNGSQSRNDVTVQVGAAVLYGWSESLELIATLGLVAPVAGDVVPEGSLTYLCLSGGIRVHI